MGSLSSSVDKTASIFASILHPDRSDVDMTNDISIDIRILSYHESIESERKKIN
jgi:hypothetical protein